jgi:hypothetical protein
MSAAAAAGDSTMGRIVLDASLTRANPQPIAYETRGGVPTGKLEFNAFKGKSPLNGFVLAVHEAYSNHRALRLTPDDIWTVITQGVGQHIYRNAERLRGKFVAHAGKKLVQVVRNDFVRGRTTREDWMGVVAELTDKVRTLDNGESKVMSHLVQQFGTTQPLHTFGYQAALLASMRNYCSYSVLTMCGIPAVEMAGTVADWRQLLEAARTLDLPGLDAQLAAWNTCLLFVLEKLVRAREHADGLDGGVTASDVEFLQTIYKYHNGSGGSRVTGWICFLFPYLGSKDVTRVDHLTWHLKNGPTAAIPHMTSDCFPPGLSNVPFVWSYYGQDIPMTIYSGFDDPTSINGTMHCVHGFAVQYSTTTAL